MNVVTVVEIDLLLAVAEESQVGIWYDGIWKCLTYLLAASCTHECGIENHMEGVAAAYYSCPRPWKSS